MCVCVTLKKLESKDTGNPSVGQDFVCDCWAFMFDSMTV